jgi:carbonic anhydrase/acetyltransferase-like protein (isoleucine patch superfamily)
MLHGCTIGDGSLIGMGATILNGAKIGRNCLIGAGALVTEGKEIPGRQPGDGDAGQGGAGPGLEIIAQRHCRLGRAQHLPLEAGTEGDAEKPDPCLRVAHRVADQVHFGALRAAGHVDQFDPIADRPQRVDKVVAQARSDQVRQRNIGHTQRVLHKKAPRMSEDLNAILEPGMLVRHPEAPDWGLGQVQSNIDGRITVNFENAGKVVLDGRRVALTIDFSR